MPPMTHLMTYKYLLELLYCLESTTFGHSSFTTVVQIQLSTSTSSSSAFAVLRTSMEQRGIIHYTLSFVQSRAYVTFCSICQPLIPELWRDLHQIAALCRWPSRSGKHILIGPLSGGSNYFKLSHQDYIKSGPLLSPLRYLCTSRFSIQAWSANTYHMLRIRIFIQCEYRTRSQDLQNLLHHWVI